VRFPLKGYFKHQLAFVIPFCFFCPLLIFFNFIIKFNAWTIGLLSGWPDENKNIEAKVSRRRWPFVKIPHPRPHVFNPYVKRLLENTPFCCFSCLLGNSIECLRLDDNWRLINATSSSFLFSPVAAKGGGIRNGLQGFQCQRFNDGWTYATATAHRNANDQVKITINSRQKLPQWQIELFVVFFCSVVVFFTLVFAFSH